MDALKPATKSSLLPVWLTLGDLALNLLSECIGIVITLVLITWIGGKLSRRWNAKNLDMKWRSYRQAMAKSLIATQTELDHLIGYLPSDIKRITSKSIDEIGSDDLAFIRERRSQINAYIKHVESFFERNHFALREQDIAPAQEYISFAVFEIAPNFKRDFSQISKFEVWLEAHCQNINPLSETVSIHGTELSRFDMFLEMGQALIKDTEALKLSSWLVSGKALAAQLES